MRFPRCSHDRYGECVPSTVPPSFDRHATVGGKHPRVLDERAKGVACVSIYRCQMGYGTTIGETRCHRRGRSSQGQDAGLIHKTCSHDQPRAAVSRQVQKKGVKRCQLIETRFIALRQRLSRSTGHEMELAEDGWLLELSVICFFKFLLRSLRTQRLV